jgi:hypothetical protein
MGTLSNNSFPASSELESAYGDAGFVIPNLEILRSLRDAKSSVTECHKTLRLDGCARALSYVSKINVVATFP